MWKSIDRGPIADSTMVDNVDSDSPLFLPSHIRFKVDVSLLHGSRIFLDICSGAGYSLTTAMLQECQCFPVDMLIDAKMHASLGLCVLRTIFANFALRALWLVLQPHRIAGSVAASNSAMMDLQHFVRPHALGWSAKFESCSWKRSKPAIH